MPLHHTEPDDDRSARQAVYEVFADRSRTVEEAIERALVVGTERLGVSLGFLTEITDGRQTIAQTVGAHETVRPGESCPLDSAYCRRTVERDSPLCVQDAGSSDEVSEVAYETFGLEAYIGTKVGVGDETYGTVCFADSEPRAEPFPETDELFVELVARLVGRALERREHDRTLRERNRRLRAEKERLQRIADTSFDLLFELDSEGRLTYVSTGIEDILGYSEAEVLGTSLADYVAPRSHFTALTAFEGVFDGQPIGNLELTALTADGGTAIVEINAIPVAADDTVVAVQGVARDVTVRRKRQAELRLKNRAIDDSTVGVVIADATEPDNPIVYVNRAFEGLTGYSREEMLGRNCRILQGPATDEAAVATLREGIEQAEPVSVDLVNYRKDGAPFWNDVRVVPVRDDDGTVTHFVGFQEDATDRNRTEQLIRLLNRVLRHNLRNELNVLLGYGELLSDPAAAAETDLEPGRVVSETVAGLTSLSEQVRELESIARQDRDPTRLDAATLLSDAVAGATATSPGATVTTRVDLPEGRDICAGLELERAITELVDNALVHDPDPPTTVGVTARDAGDSVEVVVADDGAGIPPVEASVIEAGRETTVEHGTGLGLWLVNWIVTRYGGSFQIRPATADDDVSGTVATVSVPAVDADQSVEAAVRPHTTLFQ
jgi:PAS domain S-box-containing protein